MPSRLLRTVGAPPVRAPLLAERSWTHLIACTTRIPRQIAPFIVPTVNKYHLVTLTAGGLLLGRRGLGPSFDAAEMSTGEIHLTTAGAPAYELSWTDPLRELRAVHVLVDAALIERVRDEHDEAGSVDAGAPVAVIRDRLIAELLAQLDRSLDWPHKTDDLYVDVVGELLALQLVRTSARRRGWAPLLHGRLAPRKLRSVTDYVHAHLDREIRLSDLGREAGLSRYHFVRAFEATTGVSPHAYVRQLRIEEARRLLLETTASIAEIALATGFSSQSHLSTRFRLATGITPSSFRRAATR